MEEIVKYITENWDNIPDKYKQDIHGESYYRTSGDVPNLPKEEHFVVLLLDRQKPSVEADYSFDEERIGITKTGKIIWGFDSGCSCPSPWHDNYPDCYCVAEGWKQFTLNTEGFDPDWLEECTKKFNEIKDGI